MRALLLLGALTAGSQAARAASSVPFRGLHSRPGVSALELTEEVAQREQHVKVTTAFIDAEQKYERGHSCKGCSGLSGPCITGEWMKQSTAMNHPHGMLFCSFYETSGERKGKCAKNYHDCFKKHWKKTFGKGSATDKSSGTVVHHAVRSVTPAKSPTPAAAGGASSLAALKKQIALLKLEKQISALKKSKGAGR